MTTASAQSYKLLFASICSSSDEDDCENEKQQPSHRTIGSLSQRIKLLEDSSSSSDDEMPFLGRHAGPVFPSSSKCAAPPVDAAPPTAAPRNENSQRFHEHIGECTDSDNVAEMQEKKRKQLAGPCSERCKVPSMEPSDSSDLRSVENKTAGKVSDNHSSSRDMDQLSHDKNCVASSGDILNSDASTSHGDDQSADTTELTRRLNARFNVQKAAISRTLHSDNEDSIDSDGDNEDAERTLQFRLPSPGDSSDDEAPEMSPPAKPAELELGEHTQHNCISSNEATQKQQAPEAEYPQIVSVRTAATPKESHAATIVNPYGQRRPPIVTCNAPRKRPISLKESSAVSTLEQTSHVAGSPRVSIAQKSPPPQRPSNRNVYHRGQVQPATPDQLRGKLSSGPPDSNQSIIPLEEPTFELAFGASPGVGRTSEVAAKDKQSDNDQSRQSVSEQAGDFPIGVDLYREAFDDTCEEIYHHPRSTHASANIVDLANIDEGQHNSHLPARRVIVRQGLRSSQHSPSYNVAARAFPKQAVRSTFGMVHAEFMDEIEDYDELSDSEESYVPNQKVARRVTEDHAFRLKVQRPQRMCASGYSSGTAIAILGGDEPRREPDRDTFNHGLSRATWRRTRKPRLRDAVASNPFNAASVNPAKHRAHTATLNEPSQEPSTGPQQPPNRFGIRKLQNQRDDIRNQRDRRNDVHGGSGVGVGYFTILGRNGTNGSPAHGGDSIEDDETTSMSARRRRGRSNAKANTTSSSRKRKTGTRAYSPRNGGKGRGRGRGKGRGQNYKRRSGGVWDEVDQGCPRVSEAFTREDPAMQNIGGGEISF